MEERDRGECGKWMKVKKHWLCWGLMTCQTLVGHFVSSSRGREKTERGDSRGDERWKRGIRKKEGNNRKWGNRRNNNIPPLPIPAARTAGLAQLSANISWTPQWRKIHDTFASSIHPLLISSRTRLQWRPHRMVSRADSSTQMNKSTDKNFSL